MKTDAPSTVVRSNTISEALGPTIFVPMQCSWKKLVCDGFIPVGPDGNPKSTLEICPAFAPDQRLLFANTSRISSNEQLVAKMKPRFPPCMPSTCPIPRWDSRCGQSANFSGSLCSCHTEPPPYPKGQYGKKHFRQQAARAQRTRPQC